MNQSQAMGPVFQDYSPYFQQSAGVTQGPAMGVPRNPLFGPQIGFQTNIDNGLGYAKGYHTVNAMIPYHVVPGNSVLIGDISGSVTNGQDTVFNGGLIWRNYDESRNRVFGWNVYGTLDDGNNNRQWKRIGAGVESLGRYFDFRANAYHVTGRQSVLLADEFVGPLGFGGHNVFRTRRQLRDNAYDGVDWELGGPLPVLGRRGLNMYVGGYWLNSEYGHEALGFSARWEMLATESATVSANLTNDGTFGTNSWVSVSYTIPNYRERAILRPRRVRDRLGDPVHRSTRIHSNIDLTNKREALINPDTGAPYHIVYVDPNATSLSNLRRGFGTLEDPYTEFQFAKDLNHAGVDIIRIDPRADDSKTNLTVLGGIPLFDRQVLLSSSTDYVLFTEDGTDFIIPGTGAARGPILSNPANSSTGHVVMLANDNQVVGVEIDGSNEVSSAFGTGIFSNGPISNVLVQSTTFANYDTALNLNDVSGRVVLDGNIAQGISGTSMDGLILTTAANQDVELLVQNNRIINSFYTDATRTTETLLSDINPLTNRGISIVTMPNSRIRADDRIGRVAPGMLAHLVVREKEPFAEDGKDGFDLATREPFAAILTDLSMPIMDGFEFAIKYRAWETDQNSRGHGRTPVIAVTANVTPEDMARCKEVGMDDFMAKPVTLKTLDEILRKWLTDPENGAES